MIVLLLLVAFLFQDNVPYKRDDEFKVKFELGFRKRNNPASENLILVQGVPTDHYNNSPLPHLITTLEILKKDSLAVKFRIIRDNSVRVAKRKIELNAKVPVFSAFVDDINDQIQGYQHTIYFLDKKGVRLTKIVIEFDEEGFYSVNEKRRGKI